MKTEIVKTYLADDVLDKVVSGEITIQEWVEQAKKGPNLKITEDKCTKMADKAIEGEGKDFP
jgi:hypothetical protein